MSKKVKRITIGNKEYSLNDIWRLCLKMWKDIHNEVDGYGILIHKSKIDWMEDNGFRFLTCNCFFCEWTKQTGGDILGTKCPKCPGNMVSKSFHCEYRKGHKDELFYEEHPEKFYKKPLALDKKRRSK